MRIAVNVSASQFDCADLVDHVLTSLADYGLPGDALELEITEDAIVKDRDDCVRQLQELRERGLTVAMDDFGTGYSSLSQIQRMPIDVLKIDRSFVEKDRH